MGVVKRGQTKNKLNNESKYNIRHRQWRVDEIINTQEVELNI